MLIYNSQVCIKCFYNSYNVNIYVCLRIFGNVLLFKKTFLRQGIIEIWQKPVWRIIIYKNYVKVSFLKWIFFFFLYFKSSQCFLYVIYAGNQPIWFGKSIKSTPLKLIDPIFMSKSNFWCMFNVRFSFVYVVLILMCIIYVEDFQDWCVCIDVLKYDL